MIPFDRWLVGAEHIAGGELDPTSARTAWETGMTPDEYVTSLNPPCPTCRIPGAPAHEPSRKCHNGGTRTHCSCRACFG